jgi:insulin-like growth factor 2 mRNA-binding protein 1
VNGLNGIELEGNRLKVETLDRRRNKPAGRAIVQARPTDFPLRLLVQSDMVGAIIGRQGTTIRNITQSSRARVDVHRKDNVGSLEKAITIYGNPENCTSACKRILDVMQNEANSTNKGYIL